MSSNVFLWYFIACKIQAHSTSVISLDQPFLYRHYFHYSSPDEEISEVQDGSHKKKNPLA